MTFPYKRQSNVRYYNGEDEKSKVSAFCIERNVEHILGF